MKRRIVMLSSQAIYALLSLTLISTQVNSAGSEGYLGEGVSPPQTGPQRIAPREDIERMKKRNDEISAGFVRIDSLLNDIVASRSKIKQIISNRQELTLCIALQQAHNEASRIENANASLSAEQKQTLTDYQRIHSELAADIRKSGIRCPSTSKL